MNNNGFDDIYSNKTAIIDPERNKHDRMKLFARKLLFYMGIPSKNIQEETTIEYKGKRYKVDIIGYPGKYNNDEDNPLSIAIECGNNKAEKIDALRNKFALVLILPYQEFDFLEQPEMKLIRKITKDLEQQTISNYHYLKELQDIEKKFIEIEKELKRKIEYMSQNLTTQIETDFKNRTHKIEITIQKYENDLKHLREFKDWCFKFGVGEK